MNKSGASKNKPAQANGGQAAKQAPPAAHQQKQAAPKPNNNNNPASKNAKPFVPPPKKIEQEEDDDDEDEDDEPKSLNLKKPHQNGTAEDDDEEEYEDDESLYVISEVCPAFPIFSRFGTLFFIIFKTSSTHALGTHFVYSTKGLACGITIPPGQAVNVFGVVTTNGHLPFQITSACLGPNAKPGERASLVVTQFGVSEDDEDDEDAEEKEENGKEMDEEDDDEGEQMVLTTLSCGVNEHSNLDVMLEGNFQLMNYGTTETDIHVLGHLVLGDSDEHDHDHDEDDEDDEDWYATFGTSFFFVLTFYFPM